MFKKTLISLAVASSLGLTGCLSSGDEGANANPDYKINNPDFTDRTWPLFDGIANQFPVPNDLLFAAETAGDGTMVDGDPANPVTSGIGFMDGNSVVGAFDIKLNGSLDPNQTLDARPFVSVGGAVIPNPDQNVFLLPLEFPSQDPLAQVSGEVPSFSEAIDFQVASALVQSEVSARVTAGQAMFAELATPSARAEIISLDGGINNVIRINPITPLDTKTKYLVVITNDVVDSQGRPLVGSPPYQNYSDPEQPLGNPALAPLRGAILNWEQLAAGYFGFMKTVYSNPALAGLPVSLNAPSVDDVVLSITFSTTAVDDVLQANAAPRTFFENSQKGAARKDAIGKLIKGTLNLTNQPVSTGEAADSAINSRIFTLLTDQTAGFKLYNADLAANLEAASNASMTLTYEDVAIGSDDEVNSTLAFALQTAASNAAIDIKLGGPEGIEAGAAAAEGGFVSVLGALEAPKSRTSNFFDPGKNASDINAALVAPAKVSNGEITLPYFLGVPASNSVDDGAIIKTTSWTSNQAELLQNPPGTQLPPVVAPSDKVTYRFPFAAKIDDVTVPVLATYPDVAVTGAKPAEGWPVIIYQHGITTDRSATLPLANGLASACVNPDLIPLGVDCFATIAIDQPLHGVVPSGSTVPGLAMIRAADGTTLPNASATATERHFNFSANQLLQPTPISTLPEGAASSGSLFINLSNFVNSRDNLRQGVLDLLNVNASIAAMDIDGNPNNGPDLDVNRVYFVGHSLGGVNGIPFVSVNNAVAGAGVNAALPQIQASAFLNTGGGIPKLLENSPNSAFGAPAVLSGLAAASDGVLVQGSSALETYFTVLQGILDSTDPVNFGESLAESSVLLTEIVGDGTSENPSDQTIPNAADAELYSMGPLELTTTNGFVIDSLPAPLAGTEPLIAQLNASPTASGSLPAITRFTEGSHGTPVSAGNTTVDPLTTQAVFNEMVSQVAQLFSNDSVIVTTPSVVEAPPAAD